METKIVVISDTHEKHKQLTIPECDILIHSGDCTNRGQLIVLYDFCNWFSQQPAQHKICIAGNHDHCFENQNANEAKKTMEQFGIIYLQDSDVEINRFHIFGQPWQPFFYDWSFNVHRGAEIAKKWSLIPDDTNILITHGPPHGILDLVDDDFSGRDLHQGCEELRKKVDQLPNLKLHIFGHLHKNGGNQIELNNKIFVNAAICDDRHRPTRLPQVIEI